MINCHRVLRFVLLFVVLHIATTTLHVYHVCIQNNIIPDYKPGPGLKIPVYVQELVTHESADDIQDLVVSAHQLCDIFYKTTVLEGSEIHQLTAVLYAVQEEQNINWETSKTLSRKVRQPFRKLREHVVFFRTELIDFLTKHKIHEHSNKTGVGHKVKFDFLDTFLRKRRESAYQLQDKANDFSKKAERESDNAASVLTIVIFIFAYCIILLVFCGKKLRYILVFSLIIFSVASLTYVSIYNEKSREFRAKADRLTAEFYDTLKVVRDHQDKLFKTRNSTLSEFIQTADPKMFNQSYTVLVISQNLNNVSSGSTRI